MRNLRSSVAVVFAAVLLFAQVSPARAVVVVLGGLGQACYETAYAVAYGLPLPAFNFTGTRVLAGPTEICTQALGEGLMDADGMAGTYVNRGVLLFAEGRFTPALQDFNNALRFKDSIGQAHANRGAALVALKRWREGLEAIDKGLALGAEEMEKSYYNRAIANEELGNVKEAYYDYMKAAELKPDWEAPRVQLTRFMVRAKTP